MNKALVYLAATPLVLAPLGIGVGAASAQDIGTESSAVDVAGLLGVSETQAGTGQGGSASAGTVTLGGEPLIGGVTGGSQQGAGETSGSLVSTGDTPLGSATVGGYDARVVEGDGTTTSSSSASLLEAVIGSEETVTLSVLSSRSEATSTGSTSSTDGVVLEVGGGDLEVVLLHSESGSDGEGGAFLASVNGQPLVSTQEGQDCAIDGQPALGVSCFTAEEGQTALETEAAVLDLQVVEDRLFVTLGSTSAGGAVEQPADAPSGTSAEAAALEVEDILTISGTRAESGSASAGVVVLGEETLIGGSQQGDGTESGSVVDTGQTPLGSAAVAPYEATVDGEESRSSASVLEATLIDGETVAVNVLHSDSAAGPDGSQSSTQGVVVDVGGGELQVVLLDARADGDGTGSASVATVNGEPVVGTDQADQGCALDADPLAQVACVTATEGRTTIETQAAVAEAEVVEDRLVLTIGGAGAQSDSATPAARSGTAQGGRGDDGSTGGGADRDGNEDGTSSASVLPRTGSELTLAAMVGAGALAAGGALLRAARRRSNDAVA